MEKNLQIRRMKSSDIPVIEQIEQESFADPWSRETIIEALDLFPATVFTAELQGEPVGFIICGVEDTGEEIYGHICSLAVGKKARGWGVGKGLMSRAEYAVMLQGATAMQLEVRISNTDAQRFYTQQGYQPVFQVGGYYANTEDAIVMMKWFRY